MAAVPAIVLAVGITVAAGLLTAGLAPPGSVRILEPNPGWSPNLALIAGVTLAGTLVLVGATAVNAARALRRNRGRRTSGTRLWCQRVVRLRGRPPTILGLRFALERSSGADGVSGRPAMAAVAVGVAGVVAALTLRSQSRPAREHATPLRLSDRPRDRRCRSRRGRRVRRRRPVRHGHQRCIRRHPRRRAFHSGPRARGGTRNARVGAGLRASPGDRPGRRARDSAGRRVGQGHRRRRRAARP